MARWDAARDAWRVVVDVSGPDGPRRRRYHDIKAPNTRAGRKTAELAEARLKLQAAADAEAGWPGGRTGATFAATAAAWVDRRAARWSPKTVKETKYALRQYILPTLGTTLLEAVTPRQVETMYAAWAGAGRSSSAMRRWHGIVNAIFADAERLDDLKGRNPMTRVMPAGGKARERRIPSPDDVLAVIAAAPNPMTAVYFELAAATGGRRGTLIALRWRDLDLVAGTMSCVDAVAEGCDGPVLKSTKSDQAYAVGITGPALDALRDHRHRCLETAMALGAAGDFGALFVFSRDGGGNHWNPSWPTHAWATACRRAGVPPCRLHDVRHFAATRQLAAGISNRVVAERLGCTEGNLIRTYSHRVPSPDDARAAQVMAELLAR
jgi:integrase